MDNNEHILGKVSSLDIFCFDVIRMDLALAWGSIKIFFWRKMYFGIVNFYFLFFEECVIFFWIYV